MPTFPICRAMKNAMLTLGSVALGSLIVAIIQFVRIILEFIDRKSKTLQGENAAARYLMSCLKCCTWYMEKIMKFINRNAYIIVAIKGASPLPRPPRQLRQGGQTHGGSRGSRGLGACPATVDHVVRFRGADSC